MKRIYLDNAAATPLDKRVLAAMMPYLTTEYGNPSSLHYFGQQARAAVQRARGQVAHCLGVKDDTIVFTSGGTEGDNLAILGYMQANHPDGGHIITTAVEHQAILHTFRFLSEHGYDVTVLPVESDGRVRVDAVEAAMRDDTVLLSVMYANNETGMIQPIKEIGELASERHILFHVDAVQAFGYLPIYPLEEHIDMLTLCSHKIYGPKGVGALYIRSGVTVTAHAFGGPQEHQLRAGTENVSGIVGMGEAAALLEQERIQRFAQASALKKEMLKHLSHHPDWFHLNGTFENALPNILNFSIRDIPSDIALIALDLSGVAVSAGSACAAGAIEASHVLTAMGVEKPWLKSSIRVSFGKDNNEGEIQLASNVIEAVAQRLTRQEDMK